MRASHCARRAVSSGSRPNRSEVRRSRLQHVAPDRLVTGLHVGRDSDRWPCWRQAVRIRFPSACQKKRTPPDLTGGKARAEDSVGFPIEQMGAMTLPIFLRVIFEVGILDDPDVPAHVLDRCSDRLSFPHIDRLRDDLDPAVVCRQLLRISRELSTRTIVDAYQFDLTVDRRGQNPFDDRPQGARLVVDRHEDG